MSGNFTAAAPNDFTREEVESSAFAPTPVYARTASRKRTTGTARASSGKGVSPAIMVGVPVALIAAGAVAFLALQPRNEIVADASPVVPATSPAALSTGIDSAAPAMTPATPTEMAAGPATTVVNPTPAERSANERVSGSIPAATPQRRRAEPVRVARARPAAAAPSADSATSDASATVGLPGAPVPYSATTPSGAPAPMFAPSPTPAPEATTVNPAPTMPSTPEATAPVNPDPMAPEASAVP